MNVRKLFPVVVISLSMLMTSCLLPGMIPMDSSLEQAMPVMEEDTQRVIETLQGGDARSLVTLAEEHYTDEDYARPGALTYTVDVAQTDLPVHYGYGWCAVDQETLLQNFEHMKVRLSINGQALEQGVVHSLSYTSPVNNMVCLEFAVLITEWPAGEYQLEAVATFEEEINDGMADFEAGDYVFEYNVQVSEAEEADSPTP